ncbi:hypothetical protein HPB50_013258 [Hyalomma asiaticum]|uniref:Uncharacterized protein n=1 Tax=Hyalomma asiaticum TaxID=266040 RepID=A0ACB7S641_HYAAI|nr:hypothetical protein HPB50_013258 [Hyalomma asiaticum]
MPQLPEEHQKIIMRPCNGLDLRKASHYDVSTAIFSAAGISRMEGETDLVCQNIGQNIVVVCTEKESNAKKLLRITSISGTGLSRGCYNVEPGISDGDLNALILHRKNPSAREAKGIKETGSVIVLLDGDEASDYVQTPTLKVCRGCGSTNPADGHECQARSTLCGKGHPTGNKACRQRYQTPFIVRQRTERAEERAFKSSPMDSAQLMPSGAAMMQQGWVQPSKAGGGPILPATATWTSRPPLPESTRARHEQQEKQQSAAPIPQVSRDSSQQQKRESEELKKVKEESAQLRELVSEMRKELAELRAAISEPGR